MASKKGAKREGQQGPKVGPTRKRGSVRNCKGN